MRTLLIAACGFATAIQFATADVTSKMIGTWSGKVTATTNGQAVVRNTTTVYKRYEGTGLIANTTIKALGNTVTSVTRYHKNGKVEGKVKLNGMNAGVIKGKWSATDTDFSTSFTAKGFLANFKTQTKFTLTSNKKLEIAGSTSSGERTVGLLKKK